MRFMLPLAATVALTLLRPASAEPTFADRLGYPPGSRVLIINSDDVGMCYASTQGSIEGLEAGIVTSVTAMMPCPWVPMFANYLKKNPDVCTGLHLTLCSEWDDYRFMPVAGKRAVPGLADEMGCLWDNNKLLGEHATADEVETEIRAQIERAETMGIKISHMDSHMWSVFSKPEFLERYVKVAIEKKIPVRIVGGPVRGFTYNADAKFVELCAPHIEPLWEAGLPVLDDMHAASYNWDTTDKTEQFIDAIRNLKPGVTEFVVHLTKPDDVVGKITGGRTHLYGDYTALTNPKILEVIEEEGVILVSWTDLMKKRQEVK